MTTFRVTSNADYGRAHKAARRGDTLDIDTTLRGEIKVTKPGLLLDFTHGGVDAEGAPHALLIFFADNTRVRTGFRGGIDDVAYTGTVEMGGKPRLQESPDMRGPACWKVRQDGFGLRTLGLAKRRSAFLVLAGWAPLERGAQAG